MQYGQPFHFAEQHLCSVKLTFSFYYIQINEIQQNTDEIKCTFQKVLFSLVKNM